MLGNLLLEEASRGDWLALYQLRESPVHAAHRAAWGPVPVGGGVQGTGGALCRDAWQRGEGLTPLGTQSHVPSHRAHQAVHP